jgi:glycosyltransferase 2 family protein
MNRRFALIQALCSLAALGAVIWWASKQEAPTFPHGATAYAWLVGALGLYAVATLMRGERWQRILDLTGVHAQRADSYALTTVGYAGNNILPARAGEVLKVILMSKRSGAGIRELFGTVLAERVLDALALAGIFVVVVLGILRDTPLPNDNPLLIGGLGAALAVVGAIAIYVAHRRGMLRRVLDWLRPLADAPKALLSRTGLLLLAGSLLIWTVEASVYLAVAHATGLNISMMGALYLMALTNLFAMIPAAPGYVGTFDAAVIFGVKAIGGTESAALSYLLWLRFILFVPITVVGLVLLVVRYGGWSRLRAAVRFEASSA